MNKNFPKMHKEYAKTSCSHESPLIVVPLLLCIFRTDGLLATHQLTELTILQAVVVGHSGIHGEKSLKNLTPQSLPSVPALRRGAGNSPHLREAVPGTATVAESSRDEPRAKRNWKGRADLASGFRVSRITPAMLSVGIRNSPACDDPLLESN